MREYLHILFDLHRNILFTGEAGQMVGCVGEFLHVKDPKVEKKVSNGLKPRKTIEEALKKRQKPKYIQKRLYIYTAFVIIF